MVDSRHLGRISSVPFFYILYVLWVELTASLATQPPAARKLIEVSRLVLLITWAVYPIAYAFGGTEAALTAKAGGAVDPSGIVALQVGYAIADMTAKAGFGVLIYFIARAKSTGIAGDGSEVDRAKNTGDSAAAEGSALAV